MRSNVQHDHEGSGACSPRRPSGLALIAALLRLAAPIAIGALLAVGTARAAPKSEAPVPAPTLALMQARDTTAAAPILMRAYKKESEIEVWKLNGAGRYVHLKTFPICRWSGALGPKRMQGDRQTPEGFYSVAPRQMNPNSAYYLSFDTGFPNAYDRAHGGSGSALMVHGTCSSAGCFAMTDKGVAEIYALAREALRGGQSAFQFQAYPFRMSALNMARARADPNIGFWRQLKEGSDRFEATGEALDVSVAGGRYVFGPSQDPAREALAGARRAREQERVERFIAQGAAAVRTVYADGGQHPMFAALLRGGANLGMVSRPETLAYAGIEEVLTPARGLCARKGGCPDVILGAVRPALARTPADKTQDDTAGSASDKPAGAPKIRFAAGRVITIGATEPATLRPMLLSYELRLPTPPQTVIVGAMPILPDAWF